MLSFTSDNLAASIITIILLVILFLLIDSAAIVVVKRTILVSALASEEVLLFLGLLVPGLWILFYVSLALFAVTIVVGVVMNESEFKIYLARNFKGATGNPKKHPNSGEALFDREAVYNEVYLAVITMSRKKEGALITFMRKENILSDLYLGTIVTQRGVDLDAPVKHELLETIFYEGTRLHDGAVVIVNDKVARASVFFKPTEKPLIGKFGSRHQAALGISENSDAVTIIVSEETGRISIAFQGELTPVTPDTLMRVLLEDMSIEQDEEPHEDEQ